MALGAATEGLNHGRQDVVPVLHLDRQDSQTDAELYSDRLRASCKVLEQEQYLIAQRIMLARRHLCRQVVGDLAWSVWLLISLSRGYNLSTQGNSREEGRLRLGLRL